MLTREASNLTGYNLTLTHGNNPNWKCILFIVLSELARARVDSLARVESRSSLAVRQKSFNTVIGGPRKFGLCELNLSCKRGGNEEKNLGKPPKITLKKYLIFKAFQRISSNKKPSLSLNCRYKRGEETRKFTAIWKNNSINLVDFSNFRELKRTKLKTNWKKQNLRWRWILSRVYIYIFRIF